MTLEQDLKIRLMSSEDWPEVRAIYQEGIATGDATFQLQVPEWAQWDAGHLRSCRLVATTDHRILGWAAVSPVSGREVYAGVVEVSLYVAGDARGRGIGTELLTALIQHSEREGLWTLQAGIFPENTGSLSVHQGCGFRIVGTREKIGQMNGRWRDVLLLERRSATAGK